MSRSVTCVLLYFKIKIGNTTTHHHHHKHDRNIVWARKADLFNIWSVLI